MGIAWWPQGDEMRTIEIDIEHSSFHPGEVHVEAGETVRFVIHNGDPIDHEFLIGDEVMQQIHEEGTEAHHGARPGEVSVAAFHDAVTTFEFNGPGTLLFGCHLPRHYNFGMKGEIIIE
jgi:uncharacterized cupredoxin-like copper-binding protein